MAYIKLTTQAELPGKNAVKEFEAGGKTICVANVNGAITAIDSVCLHMGGPLGEGCIEAGRVVCPWHGWEYDPATGQLGDDPKTRLAVYPIKIENGDVLVEL